MFVLISKRHRPNVCVIPIINVSENRDGFEKIAVDKREDAGRLRDYWHQRLMEVSGLAGIAVERPKRLAQGMWMTIGNGLDYRRFKDGALDMHATIEVLRGYERLLDLVAQSHLAVQAGEGDE